MYRLSSADTAQDIDIADAAQALIKYFASNAIPVPKIPDIESTIQHSIQGQIANFFAGLWGEASEFIQLAAQQQMQVALERLVKSPWPSLEFSALQDWWNNIFGLTLIIAAVVFVVQLAIVMYDTKNDGLSDTIKGLGRTILVGSFGLMPIAACLLLAEFAMSLVLRLTNTSATTDTWSESYSIVQVQGPGEVIAQMALLSVIGVVTLGLVIQASTQVPALLFGIYAWLFSSALGGGTLGRLARGISLGSVYSFVFSRVIQVAMLGLGVVVMSFGEVTGFNGIAITFVAAMMAVGAFLVQPTLFIVLAFILVVREQRRDPAFISKVMSSQVVRSISTAVFNDQRISNSTAAGNGGQLGSQQVKAAATTAAVAGIGKMTASVLAVMPTPQTKIAAIGVAAASNMIQNAGQNLQGRVSSVINPIDTPK